MEEVQEEDPVRNINTLAIEVDQLFRDYVDASHAVSIQVEPEFRKGFFAGISALQKAFLIAMDRGELDYKRK